MAKSESLPPPGTESSATRKMDAVRDGL